MPGDESRGTAAAPVAPEPPAGRMVGNAAARAVRGTSFAADVVLVPATAVTATATATAAAGQSTAPGTTAGAIADNVLAVVPGGVLHRAATLADLVELARSGTGPLVLVEDGVTLEPPALLDLLDGPGDPTVALLVDPHNLEAPRQQIVGLEAGVPARVGADGRLVESSATSVHRVGAPNRLLAGMLRISSADRRRAAELWARARADQSHVSEPFDLAPFDLAPFDRAPFDRALFDLALLVLVRGGLPVAARSLGYYRWTRGAAGQSGAPDGPWSQRLRTASRGGDGLYSFVVVRRLSRRGTALALRFGWSPNLITTISLLVGLATAVLITTGRPWAWVLAAITLQLALVIDCMDGEVARFTRRYSALGGWLDGVGDRVKEYAVFAALALVAVRDGQPSGWLLALIAMALVTGRHLEDYAYTDQLAPRRTSRPDLLPLEAVQDARAAAGERVDLGPAPSARNRTVFWLKKLVHLPIAERYLLISLLLLTFHPAWVLIGTIVANGLALAWALGGRVLREARRPRDTDKAPRAESVDARQPRPGGTRAEPVEALRLEVQPGPLDHQLDLGPLARTAGRLGRGPFLPGVGALVAVWLGAIACICAGLGPVAFGGTLLAAVITGVTFAAPLRNRFGWLVPPLLWAAEAAVAAALIARGPVGGFVFVFLAAAAYRRYDLIYSVRLNGPPARLSVAGPGSDGRIVLITVLLSLAGVIAATTTIGEVAVLGPGLLIAAALVLAPALIASVRQWRH